MARRFTCSALSSPMWRPATIISPAPSAGGLPGAQDWDDRMSRARHDIDWEKMFSLSIDPEKARRYREESRPQEDDTCTMCGRLCAVRTMNRVLAGMEAG